MKIKFTYKRYSDYFLKFNKLSSAVRNELRYEHSFEISNSRNLYPKQLWDRTFHVTFAGVNGCVYVTIFDGKTDYKLFGNCKDCHAKSAIQYLCGKRFQRKLFKSISACKGTVD